MRAPLAVLPRLAAAALIVTTASVSRAECSKDTSSTKPRTLIHGIAAFHMDYGAGTSRIDGGSTTTLTGRLGMALCRWPDYTLTLLGGGIEDGVRTSFTAPGSTFHPSLRLNQSGYELARRWRNHEIVHPMVSLEVGSIQGEYTWIHDGVLVDTGASHATYVTPSVGGEVSLFKYMTAYLTLGYRMVGQIKTPGITGAGLSGLYEQFGLGFGKFR